MACAAGAGTRQQPAALGGGRSHPERHWQLQLPPTPLGDPDTAGSEPLYVFRRADTALLDEQAWNLAQDFGVLWGLMHELPMDSPRRHELLRAMERAAAAVDPQDVSGSAGTARKLLEPALSAPAAASAHRIHAVGHAHIDSAWLWPVRETRRKVARTFANVLAPDGHRTPAFVFTASSAQQYAWLEEDHPALFARVAARVAEGRFVPAGGMWVEADTNLPSGESLVRQFTFGKRFFLEAFGVEPLDVWLPDSFGYSGALPQLIRAAGSRWFLTQKTELERIRRDASPHLPVGRNRRNRVFTHFPPVDTYNSALTGQELARAQRQFREKGATNLSLVPFGWGDGGGGPTREMLAAAHRTASLEGSPPGGALQPASVLHRGRGGLRRPARVVRGNVPAVPPRDLHLPGPDQTRQPAQRGTAERS